MSNSTDLREATLAVLAGGRSRRMGFSKAMLRIGGKPILQYLLETLQWPGPTLLVTAPSREHPAECELFDSEAVDPVEQGPLGGVLTALENARTPYLVIVTVDMPGMRRAHLEWIIRRLMNQPDLLGLMLKRTTNRGEQIEPFPLVCRRGAEAPIARKLLEGNGAVHSLTELPEFVAAAAPSDWPEDVWTNLNWPEEYRRFIACLTDRVADQG